MLHQDFPVKTLRACIRKHLNISEESIRFSPVTTGKFNTSFYVFTEQGEYVLRIAPSDDVFCLFYERRMMKQEPHLHTLLHEKTGIPVAQIYAFDDTQDLIPNQYLIMECLPGKAMSESWTYDVNTILREVGNCLQQAHALTSETYGYIGEHHPMPPQNNWTDAFVMMWNKLIDDVTSSGYYNDHEASHLRTLLDRYVKYFDRPVNASLLHMDVWAQNILIDEHSHVTGLVDWDRALWGDPEIEFAVLDYCGISEPAFWQGYEQERDLSNDARIRSIFYLLYELQKYIPIRHFRQNSPDTARRYKAQVMRIVEHSF
ncbi:aminoglycoside phosphotransferase family protein [bacterium]|nr:aminoglycoside phosphotransferase family protein [bacterium]